MLQASVIVAYVDRIYDYALRKTYTREEADELSQEILFTLVRELPRLRDESRLEPWLWGVAGNVARSFRRSMGKQRAMYFYDVPEEIVYDETAAEEAARNEELYAILREKIAMLSSVYRNMIILHYYEGLSTKQISERLTIPEGTVTWRLSEARRKLKKECTHMEESALKPIQMRIDIYGSGNYNGKERPFPSEYIKDALSQNILYHCYKEPKGIEELAKLCGVPAYYIEDCLENLTARDAVTEPVKQKYQTAFLIWTDEYGKYQREHAQGFLMPIMERMIAALKGIAEESRHIDFYKAGKSEDELFYLYSVLAFSCMEKAHYHRPYPPVSKKYDGNSWEYIGYMETRSDLRRGVGIQTCHGDNVRYSHWVFCFGEFQWREMMPNEEIRVCDDILNAGKTTDEYRASETIRKGYLKRLEDGSLAVMTPAFTQEQKKHLDQIAEKHMGPLMDEYCRIVDEYVDGYRRLFPKHLADTAARMCKTSFLNMFVEIIAYAQEHGEIPLPPKDSICDVLLRH
ncbi:MAG: RNA polymerase sigma factor [Lachnospiraceae bacterium]|nr:RNA polymerase sigma factor [Lachnospiraceae bacterium]